MSLEAERWLPVVGFNGYEVSNLGRVRSYLRQGARGFIHSQPVMLATHLNTSGYHCLSLMKQGGGYIKKAVHRLVAIAFHADTYKPHLEVNHKDSNRANPRASNLEWVTRKENCLHASRFGYGAKAKLSDDVKERVRNLCIAGESCRSLVKRFKVSTKYIARLSRQASSHSTLFAEPARRRTSDIKLLRLARDPRPVQFVENIQHPRLGNEIAINRRCVRNSSLENCGGSICGNDLNSWSQATGQYRGQGER